MSSGNNKRSFWAPLFTLQARLFLWNTAVILVLTATMLFGLREGLLYTLVREEDQLLKEDITEVRLFLERSRPINWDQVHEALQEKATGHEPRGWFSEIFTENGSLKISTAQLPDGDRPAINRIVPFTGTFGSFRIHQQPLVVGQQLLIIRVGASLGDVSNDVARVTQLAMIAGFILLLVAPAGGYLLAHRATRPLTEINRTTAGLRPSHLEERLMIRGTGDELDQLAETINGFLDRIAHYLGQHRELLANAAHELRSPLTAIRSSAEVALNQDRTSEEYKDFLGIVIEESSRLGALVDQLLLLGESDARRFELSEQAVQLDHLVRRCAEMFEGVADNRRIKLKLNVSPVSVRGNANHLRQVFLNLLDNAIKFTPMEGVIEIRVWSEGNRAFLEVSDSGIGISLEDQPRVFERFFRSDHSRTRGTSGGSGLGLSICQAIVEAHQGTISLRSRLNHGTTFRVEFPLFSHS